MPNNNHYPSLFLLLNVHEAVWYRVEENKVEEVASYKDEKDSYEDHEGQFGRSGGEPDVLNAQTKNEQVHNFREIATKTATIWKENGYVHLTCALHERLKNQFLDELKKVLNDVSPKLIFGNRTKAGKKEVLEMFQDSLKVVL